MARHTWEICKETLVARTRELFREQQFLGHQRTDQLFAGLMVFQWLAAIVIAVWVSPLSWQGTVADVHLHVWAALLLGGAITLFPVCLALLKPGEMFTRHVIAVSQMLMSALLIHLSGGRIETHFHVFGSLAFLAFYQDWRVLVTASLVVALDHGLRGLYWPQSVYGVATVEPWRWLEHTGWVLFEDIFLALSINKSLNTAKNVAYRQAELENVNEVIEGKVIERTQELQSEIAERKQAERDLALSNHRLLELSDELERSRDQAVRTSCYKSEFLANMSHEIRTPLNAVVGMSDLLMRTPLSDEQREFGNIIHSSADVLLSLVNDILDYSKIEAGHLDLEFTDFDIVELVEGTADLVAERARTKHLRLVTFISTTIPRMLRGDPGRIRQVLLNFLSNSIKFTDQGEILVRADLDTTVDKAVRIRFSVRDTGIGLNDLAIERLFQPFMQADSSITRKYGGTGLGLAISKRLVELMGGKIGCESVYGEGSLFHFSIELTDCMAPEEPHPDSALPGTRILIMDGSAGVQQMLSSYLNVWGADVTTATDIDKGSRILRREAASDAPFDLAIVVLTNSDGVVERATDLRRQLAKTKLIVVGNASDSELFRPGVNRPFVYLSLPLKQGKLIECITKLLTHPSTAEYIASASHKAELTAPQPCNLILVVEDNAANQKVALLQLRELGLAAHAVGNGLEAIEAVSRTQYALILMDCQMPEMDGIQATRMIRKREAVTGEHSLIVAMTAHAMSSDRLECLEAGMDDYISKPVSQKKLAEVIERWLPKSSRAASLLAAGGETSGPNSGNYRPIEFAALRATFGEDIGRELLPDFLDNVEMLVSQVTDAVETEDICRLTSLLHELKGTCATFFATEMAELSREFESVVGEQKCNWEHIRIQHRLIRTAWARAKAQLEQESATNSSTSEKVTESESGCINIEHQHQQ